MGVCFHVEGQGDVLPAGGHACHGIGIFDRHGRGGDFLGGWVCVCVSVCVALVAGVWAADGGGGEGADEVGDGTVLAGVAGALA